MAQGSASNAWDLVPPDDRTPQAWEQAARFSFGNLMNVLHQPFGTAIVAEEDGRPVAFVLVAIGPDSYTGQLYGYLADIYVDPAFRRQGLSLRLHQEAERYFTQRGVRRAKLWIGAANQTALDSARMAGFEAEGYVLSKTYPESGDWG